jgi:hypothetical protein
VKSIDKEEHTSELPEPKPDVPMNRAQRRQQLFKSGQFDRATRKKWQKRKQGA